MEIVSNQNPELSNFGRSFGEKFRHYVFTALGLLKDFFTDIFRYREYLKQSVARDLRRRYKRSSLGYIWSMLNPLLMMCVLALVFSNIMKHNIEDYAVFLFCGMLPYTYFSSTSNGCLGTIRSNAKIIDQVAVPKYIFPLSIALSGLIDLMLSLVPLFLVIAIVGRPFHWTILALPIVLLPLFLVSMGVALIVAVSNVFFEDTQHLIEVVFRAVYFLCPILYRRDQLPEWLQEYVVLNPVFCVIEFNRGLFYEGTLPDPGIWLLNMAGCLTVLLIGLSIFRKGEERFVYFL